jgi:hypothetical protein
VYGLSGSEMNKLRLKKILDEKGFDSNKQNDLFELLEQCEIATFTKAEPAIGKKRLLFRIKEILRSMI